MNKILFLFLIIGPIDFSIAEETCLSGNPEQNNLSQQLSESEKNNPVTQSIYNRYSLSENTESKVCTTCSQTQSSLNPAVAAIPIEKAPAAPSLLFNSECLKQSNQFKSQTAEVSCPDGKKFKNRNFCISNKLMKYQNAVISDFVNCTSKEEFGGLDPQFIFQMYSLETGFRPQYSYSGGVGVGQLTKIFVDDIHQKHRGFKFLKKVAESKQTSCSAAQIIAKKDLNQKPNIKNDCSFTSVGEGLERNILYSLIGLANSWEKDIEPKLKPYLEKHKGNPNLNEIKNLCLLNAYGHGGRAAARAAIARLSHLPPEKFLKLIKKPLYTSEKDNLTSYLTNMNSRKLAIESNLPEPLKTQFKSNGTQACIN